MRKHDGRGVGRVGGDDDRGAVAGERASVAVARGHTAASMGAKVAVVGVIVTAVLSVSPVIPSSSGVSAAVGLGVTPAAAHTDDSPAAGGWQWHPWSSDGCSHVPDAVWGVFEFTHACQHHDGCYRHHFGTRAVCDRRFRADMVAGCAWFNLACRTMAYAYYAGVRALGAGAYLGQLWRGSPVR